VYYAYADWPFTVTFGRTAIIKQLENQYLVIEVIG